MKKKTILILSAVAVLIIAGIILVICLNGGDGCKHEYVMVDDVIVCLKCGKYEEWEKIEYASVKDSAGKICGYEVIGVNYETKIPMDKPLITELTIPDTYKDIPVTAIADNAFKDFKTLEKIIIGNNVTKIGTSAFDSCYTLQSVTLPESLRVIGDRAFAGCSLLKTVVIPKGVTEIGSYAFSYCLSLEEISLPLTLNTVKDFAFQYCVALREMTVPRSVTTFGSFIFDNCTTGSMTVNISLSKDEIAALPGWAKDIDGKCLWMCKATEYDQNKVPTKWVEQVFKALNYNTQGIVDV